jgi:hypothetical protein
MYAAIAFGKRLFGRVDRVPGKYHVATLCWHFCYLPLIPLGSFLVIRQRMTGMTTDFEGIRIPLSAKSLLIAWSRSLLAVPFTILLIALVVIPAAADHPDMSAYRGAVIEEVLVALLLFGPYLVPGLGPATAGRADELARLAAGSVADRVRASGHHF